MDYQTLDWVVFPTMAAFGIVFGAIYWYLPIRLTRPPVFWPYSAPLWAALLRAGSLASHALGLTAMFLMFPAFAPLETTLWAILSITCLVGGVVLAGVIVLVNKPTFLVPVRFRHEVGYLKVLQRRRERQNSHNAHQSPHQ